MTQAKLANLVKLITVVASVFLFVLVCIIIFQYAHLGSLNRKISALDKEISEMSVTEAELKEGIKRRENDAYIEQQARENLGMVSENGETIYIVE